MPQATEIFFKQQYLMSSTFTVKRNKETIINKYKKEERVKNNRIEFSLSCRKKNKRIF